MEITATNIKNFFKAMGVVVRVKSNTHYVQVWISAEPSADYRQPLVFKYSFPLEFRVKCLEVIYPGMKGNERGNAGNIQEHSLAMRREEWAKVLAK